MLEVENITSKRIISDLALSSCETKVEASVRPRMLSEYIGQTQVREQLHIFISAAKFRQEALDHVLLFGPPGLGKTTLANIIAYEMQAGLKQTSGPALEKSGDLAAILTNLQAGDVLFIDEIHRLSAAIEEILYPAMEDHQLDIIIGEGPGAQSVKIDLPPFTLVGATTRAGLLTAPLRDRFGILQRLEFYSVSELEQIVTRSSKILNIAIDASGVHEIARRARGTPRIGNRLLRRVRDYAQYNKIETVDQVTAAQALKLLDVDDCGFDKLDQQLLQIIIERFAGGPVGVESLAASMGETRGTLEELIEPYLIQQGFIVRSPRGRMATDLAYQHLGLQCTNIK